MVYDISTTYGHVYALTYMNPYTNGGIIYRAEAIVDYFNAISEYRFTLIVESQLTDYSALLWML